jgi:heme-degrading monooxygenase HmoA
MDADGGHTLGRPAIARVWRGATRGEDSRAYRESLRADLREVRSVEGNLGAFVLERAVDGRAEFQFVSLWESMDAVVGFAGSDADRAVYFRDDERVLLELTPRVEHYDVVAVETHSRFGELPGQEDRDELPTGRPSPGGDKDGHSGNLRQYVRGRNSDLWLGKRRSMGVQDRRFGAHGRAGR